MEDNIQPVETETTVTDSESKEVDNSVEKEETSVKAETPKTYTQEEYDKAIQSSKSKAKNEILKDLGISGVKEFKDYTASVAASKAEVETQISQYKNTKSALDVAMQDLAIYKNSVNPEYKTEVLTLAAAKVSDDMNIEQAVQEVLKKTPFFAVGSAEQHVQNKVGVDRSTTTSKVSAVDIKLQKSYPWLKEKK